MARRELLAAAADAFDQGRVIDYREDAESYTTRPYGEAAAAARMLEAFGLGELRLFLGKNFDFSITASGYELARDPAALAHELPISETRRSSRRIYGASGTGRFGSARGSTLSVRELCARGHGFRGGTRGGARPSRATDPD